ncbi:hypothetical protein DV532_27180 (plasmid) [Pseudomonas sp. Leaf58]|uniref:hypothetical protein n=1 Tax=Pseudomonas sp. Leaf58 TaxID=1736226 RepID=UPI0006F3F31B|nr:hypothetical protein [Pseudomonas sp. Leaf58]AYG47967.1 hypothetical protein DV532_27180 [Pseudomonas sp. Leaf58]KQN62472.1 hypothetical protein ASF02_10000 [Pseudomonas sp. Leaf58]
MKKLFAALLALLPLTSHADTTIVTGNSSVTINGKTYHGRNVSVSGNGNVVVDGVRQEGSLVGPITVVVNGDANSISTQSGDVRVQGGAKKVKTMSGDVHVAGNILGDVSTMSGDITAQVIKGGAHSETGDIGKGF